MIGRFLSLALLGVLALAQPASAQYLSRPVTPPPSAGGSGTAPTPNTTHEKLGFGTGIGTSISTSTANAKGTCVSIGTTANDWTAFTLNYRSSATSLLLDVATDSGCATQIVTNLPIRQSFGSERQTVAVKVATGTTLYARIQASNGGAQSIDLAILGTVKQTGAFAGFNALENLAADTTTSRGSSVAVPQTSVWTQISASTGKIYQGFAVGTSPSSTTPTLAQIYTCDFGTGAASSEVAFAASMGTTLANSSQGYIGALTSIFRNTPISTRIAVRAAATTTTPDTVGCVIMGYY